MPNFFGAPSPRHDTEIMTWNQDTEEEFLCDVAAAELLMPRREFVPRLRDCGMRIEAIAELAADFGSSLEATALNVVKANLGDMAVIVWEKGWNKKQRQDAATPSLFSDDTGFGPIPQAFRIKLALSCGQLRDYHFPRDKSIREDSLIYEAAATTLSVCGFEELPIGGGTSKKFSPNPCHFQFCGRALLNAGCSR